MNKLNLYCEPQLPEYLDNILKYYNEHYRKNYLLEISSTGLAEVINFDNDYDKLFEIGYQFGTKIRRENLLVKPNLTVNSSLDNNLTYFRIISNDDRLIVKVISDYNSLHQTDFSVERFEYDEVVFAFLKAEKIDLANIFHLGCAFGIESQKAREAGHIDW